MYNYNIKDNVDIFINKVWKSPVAFRNRNVSNIGTPLIFARRMAVDTFVGTLAHKMKS